MSGNKLLVLIGCGPGVGVSTASLFASKGFNIALISRDAKRLKDDAQKVQSSAQGELDIKTFAVDVADHQAFMKTLQDVHQTMGLPEVVIFNAARVGPSSFGEFTPEELMQDYRINNVGIYVAATWAVPLLAEVAKQGSQPAFFLSGSGIGYQPFSPFFSLSMQKAAQDNFLLSLDQIAAPQGIHIARIDINGLVSPSDPVTTPDACAQQHWKLYQQPEGSWKHAVELGNMGSFSKAMGVPSNQSQACLEMQLQSLSQ
jgi:NAD(P)-dependent dehydrogenase (short-subunit alcohol dehydrogenase family)